MNLEIIKALMQEVIEESERAHQDYSNKSATHKAALQIINFEKEFHYGDDKTHHLKKIKEIIEFNAEDILNEIN